jgi:hypothetical protein
MGGVEREGVTLTNQEAWDLVHSILEGVDFADGGEAPRNTWAMEMRQWCETLLDRYYAAGGGAT